MNLYLVQHGQAKSKAEDPQRPLTERGREEIARIATWAANYGVEVKQIRHSGKRRAKETASIFADHLSPVEGMVEIQGMAPKDEVHPMVESLNEQTQPVMLVGHLPFLDRLTSQLVIGKKTPSVVRFRMGGIVCVVREDSDWVINWVIMPDQIP